MATPPAPQTASRVASGRLLFGKPTDDGKVKGVRLRGVRSFGNGGAGAGGAYGRRVAVEAVNGAVRPNGAAALADVRQVPAPPPAASVEDDDGDAFRLGKFVEGRLVYRQQFVIRSYEIGPDRTATMETLMNLLQVHAKTHLFSLNPCYCHIRSMHLTHCMCMIAHPLSVYFLCHGLKIAQQISCLCRRQH